MKNSNLSGNLFTKTALREKETSLSAKIAEYLNLKKAFVLRLNSGKVCVIHKNGATSWVHLCPAGTPDRFFIYKGFHIFLEIKKLGEKATSDQLTMHEIIKKSGGYVKTVSSLDEVIEIINWIDKETKNK